MRNFLKSVRWHDLWRWRTLLREDAALTKELDDFRARYPEYDDFYRRRCSNVNTMFAGIATFVAIGTVAVVGVSLTF